MAIRFAGIAFVKIDGNMIPLQGNLTISPNTLEREMIAGQDGIHGYRELPRVPWIQLDLSTLPDVELEELERQTNVTVVAQCANNVQYSLGQATCRGGIEVNTRDGRATVRWEGISCEEMSL